MACTHTKMHKGLREIDGKYVCKRIYCIYIPDLHEQNGQGKTNRKQISIQLFRNYSIQIESKQSA